MTVPAPGHSGSARVRPAVRILLLDESDRLLLFRATNPDTGQRFWLSPGGGIEPGEDVAAAARRELFEETGYRAEGLAHLVSVHTSTGRSTEVCHLFRCRAVRDERGPRPEQTEFIRVVELPFEEAVKRAVNGGISDAPTVLGLLWPASG